MRKGSVRWETIGLRSKAGEIWRVLDRLIGQQNKTLNETNPSINAKLPATPHNPVGEVRDGVAAMSLFQDLMTGHIGACTFHADSPLEAARRLATVKGADAGIMPYEANQMISEAVDLLVQISIRHEVRRVTAISNVAKDLKKGDVFIDPIYRYIEESSENEPRWGKIMGKTK